MTEVVRISGKEMHKKTGFKTALGYSLPKKDKILIRKGLDKKTEKKVLEHEEEHIRKGEEGPFLGAILGAGASLLGGIFGSKSAGKAADAQTQAGREQIEFMRESRDIARADQAPYREAGYTALDALMSLTGLSAPSGGGGRRGPNRAGLRRGIAAGDYLRGLGGRRLALRYGGGPVYNINELGPENRYEGGHYTRSDIPQTIEPSGDGYIHPRFAGGAIPGRALIGYAPRNFLNKIRPTPTTGSGAATTGGGVRSMPAKENPGGVKGGYNFMTDPGYEFRVSEGMRALDRGAASAGGLLSGGYARRAIRYGQDYASNEYTNVYNRIANIAGLGQVSAHSSANAALTSGYGMANAAGNIGAARASGYAGQYNAWANTANQLSQIDWGSVFNRGGGTSDWAQRAIDAGVS